MILEEQLKYAENQLQTVGANIKQFCSDLVREVILQSSVDTMDGAAYDFSLAQNTDEVYIDGDHFEKEACNESRVHSCSGQPVKVSRQDLSLEETVNAGIMENHAEEMQLKLEMSNSVILDNKDLSFWVLSPNSDDLLEGNSCTKIIPTGMPSSGSVNILHSWASEVLDRKLTLGDGSVESAENVKGFFLKMEGGSRKQDHEQHAALYGSPDLGSCKPRGEVSASSSVTTSNHEFFKSDWEII